MATVTEILELEQDEFNALVNQDVRDMSDKDTHDALRSPDLVDRWHNTLLMLKRNAESQFATDKATRSEKRVQITSKHEWLKFLAERDRWKASNNRFRSGVEDKLREAKVLRHELRSQEFPSTADAELRKITSDVVRLKQAIREHRASIHPDDATEYDETLWAALEGTP